MILVHWLGAFITIALAVLPFALGAGARVIWLPVEMGWQQAEEWLDVLVKASTKRYGGD